MEWFLALFAKVMEFVQGNVIQVIGGFLYLAVEFWLGKTDLVKSGSTLELVLNWIKKILEFLKIKKPE
jgi:hypothetical protein